MPSSLNIHHLVVVALAATGLAISDLNCKASASVAGCPQGRNLDDETSLLQSSHVLTRASSEQLALVAPAPKKAVAKPKKPKVVPPSLRLNGCVNIGSKVKFNSHNFLSVARGGRTPFKKVERLDPTVQVFSLDGKYAIKQDEKAGRMNDMSKAPETLMESDLYEKVQRIIPEYMIHIYAKGCKVVEATSLKIKNAPKVGEHMFVMDMLPPGSEDNCMKVLSTAKSEFALLAYENVLTAFLKMYKAGLTDIDHAVTVEKNIICSNQGQIHLFDFGIAIIKSYMPQDDWEYQVYMAFTNFVAYPVQVLRQNKVLQHDYKDDDKVREVTNQVWTTILGKAKHPYLEKEFAGVFGTFKPRDFDAKMKASKTKVG